MKLIQVWASLLWSEVQSIVPTELRLIEGRLTTVLRQTKTSGPTKQVKELPVCVSEKAFFANPDWLKAGFDPLKGYVSYPRDYLIPRLKSNGELGRSMASDGDATVSTAGVLSKIGLLPVVQGYWTNHLERAVLPTGIKISWGGGNPKGPILMHGRTDRK